MSGAGASALPKTLARPHAWAHSQPWLARFTVLNRVLLAIAFLPTGLVKLTGQRFTTLPLESPVGFFFEAMYRTGPYWHFIGLVQVAAAVLLLVPATATLGALLSLPVGVSIALITWGVGFQGTVYVTAGMLLAIAYLLCWDGDRIWAAGTSLLGGRPGPGLFAHMTALERAGWVVASAAGTGLFLVTRSFLPSSATRWLLLVGAVAALMVVSGWLLTWRAERTRSRSL